MPVMGTTSTGTQPENADQPTAQVQMLGKPAVTWPIAHNPCSV